MLVKGNKILDLISLLETATTHQGHYFPFSILYGCGNLDSLLLRRARVEEEKEEVEEEKVLISLESST